jgi:hypothetical protein
MRNTKPTENLTGQTVGLWKVLELTERPAGRQGFFYMCECQCETKTKRPVAARDLAKVLRGKGGSHNCGCEREKINRKKLFIHGESPKANKRLATRTYSCWNNMKNRVLRPSTEQEKRNYAHLTIDPRWIESYVAFKEDMGECPPDLEIDRIDPHKGYYKENCRYTTTLINARNRRNARVWKFKEEYLNGTQLSELSPIGIKGSTVRSRLNKYQKDDVTDEIILKVLTTPPQR